MEYQRKEDDLTSIIISCYITTQEQVDITRRCIQQVRDFTTPPYELVIVDNGSSLGQDLLEDTVDIYVRNKENLGCSVAWNQGIRVSKGEYVCIMHNDLLVFEEWLEGLIGVLERDERYALVCPTIIGRAECGEIDKTARVVEERTAKEKPSLSEKLGFWLNGDIDKAAQAAKEQTQDNYFIFTSPDQSTDALFFCRRAIYDELGALDETIDYGTYAVMELCARLHKARCYTLSSQRACCFHFGATTWKSIKNHEEAFSQSREVYNQKYKREYAESVRPIADKIKPRKKIAIITAFSSLDPMYSLTGVVRDQLEALEKHGYDYSLFVCEEFEDERLDKYNVNKCVPKLTLTDYQPDVAMQDDFEEQAEAVEKALVDNLNGFDIAITHDLMFLTWYVPHNLGVRYAAKKLPNLRWLHWIHSAPSLPPEDLRYPHTLRYQGMENSKFVFLNHWDAPRVAQMYDVPESDIRIVHNPKDLRSFFDLDEVTTAIVEKYDLFSTDVLCVYPTRMSPAKQPDKAIKIVAKIKEQGLNAKILFCNSYSNNKPELDYIKQLKQIALAWGLEKQDIIFTSEEGHPLGVPPRVVKELLQIANLFIMPSISECCSLTTLEAALAKNLVVLNDDFPPMRELGEHNALYFKFSSALLETEYYPSEAVYMGECAKRIIAELKTNKSLGLFQKVKRCFNYGYIFKHEVEPLFYEEWEGQ